MASDPRVSIPIQAPLSFKIKLEEAATAAGMNVSGFARKCLADALGVKVPQVGGAQRKYATPEEREAANKARAKDRRDFIAGLLAEHRAKMAEEAGTK